VATAGWAELSFDGTIAPEVYDYHKNKLCVVLAISSNLEMDHKDGRKHNFKPVETCDEFQPLSKAVNDAKRTHCNRCKSTTSDLMRRNSGFMFLFQKGLLTTEGPVLDVTGTIR